MLVAALGAMAAAAPPHAPDLRYQVLPADDPDSYVLQREDGSRATARGLGELLFLIEKDIVVELQRRRGDLYFLHSAVLEWRGRACLFAADSGSGKSTTAWALLHHGFRYLSDELAPIDPIEMLVWPYPHALCLKRHPPAPYALPADVMDLGRTLHVPTDRLPSPPPTGGPLPIGAIFFVKYQAELATPQLRRMAPSEAAARLYIVALNALAHPNRGLDVALRIGAHVPCYQVSTAGLAESCVAIRAAADEAIDEASDRPHRAAVR